MEPELGTLSSVPPVNQDLTLRGFVESADEVDQGGLAGPGFSYYCHIGPLGHLQIEVLEDHLIPVRVAEGDILEFHIPLQGFPVFFLRVEVVPVLFNNLRSVRHIGLLMHELHEALDIDLDGQQGRNRRNQKFHGFHHADRIGHEDRKLAQLQGPLHGNEAAPPEDDGQAETGNHRDQGGKEGRIVAGPDRRPPVFLRILLEILLHQVFDDQGLNAADAGNAFVEVAGNLRIQFPHLPVQAEQLLLKEEDNDCRHRHQEDDRQGQAGIHDQHGHENEDEVRSVPDEVHHPPGHEFPDFAGIAHDAGVYISHIILIEIRKGQGLQMVERSPPQVPVHVHLDFPTGVHREVVVRRLQQGHEDIY